MRKKAVNRINNFLGGSSITLTVRRDTLGGSRGILSGRWVTLCGIRIAMSGRWVFLNDCRNTLSVGWVILSGSWVFGSGSNILLDDNRGVENIESK